MLLRLCGASPGDQLLLLDADERIQGRLDDPPAAHAMVLLRNLKPNDLPGIRTDSLDPLVRPVVPLLRWLRWSPTLRCHAPGSYLERHRPIEPYLINQLRQRSQQQPRDRLTGAAYRVLRDLERELAPEQLTTFPIVNGIEIHHVAEATPERIAAKRAYYEGADR